MLSLRRSRGAAFLDSQSKLVNPESQLSLSPFVRVSWLSSCSVSEECVEAVERACVEGPMEQPSKSVGVEEHATGSGLARALIRARPAHRSGQLPAPSEFQPQLY